jgi:hypothetical protein
MNCVQQAKVLTNGNVGLWPVSSAAAIQQFGSDRTQSGRQADITRLRSLTQSGRQLVYSDFDGGDGLFLKTRLSKRRSI